MELEKAHNWTDQDKLTTVSYDKKRKFVCIEYPGLVKNVEKAIQTLGGLDSITDTYHHSNKRVGCYLRPGDVFCKPCFGERHTTSSLVVKVKMRRRKGDKTGESCQFQVHVLGSLETTYRFNSLSDFQYLPVIKKSDGSYEQILDKIVLKSFVDRNEYLERGCPLFLPPVLFSRFDVPDKDYLFRDSIIHRPGYADPVPADRPANLIGTVRERRTVYTVFLNFQDNVPEKPDERAVANLRIKYNEPHYEEELAKLFEKRPIWSRIGLNHHFSGKRDKVKYLLPMKACYYLNGPWRCMWVKYGYDPRKHPEAKIYQTVDYRKRQVSPVDPVGIKLKRSVNIMAFPALKRSNANIAKINLSGIQLQSQEKEEKEHQVPQYIYIPERLPPCRQMFYQICDIRVEEIQDMVANYTSPVCDEKDGWCQKGTIDKCREIMTRHAQDVLDRKGFAVPKTRKNKGKGKASETATETENERLIDDDDDDGYPDDEMDDARQEEDDDVNEMETEMLNCV